MVYQKGKIGDAFITVFPVFSRNTGLTAARGEKVETAKLCGQNSLIRRLGMMPFLWQFFFLMGKLSLSSGLVSLTNAVCVWSLFK